MRILMQKHDYLHMCYLFKKTDDNFLTYFELITVTLCWMLWGGVVQMLICSSLLDVR